MSGLQPVSPPGLVTKRSGAVVPFDARKIHAAITRAGAATGEFDAAEAEFLTAQAMKVLSRRFTDQPPHIEQIQDVVEQALIRADHFDTARAYIVYRDQHTQGCDRTARRVVEPWSPRSTSISTGTDWRVNANANQGYSLGGLILNVSGKVDRPTTGCRTSIRPEVGSAHRDGDIHIHDLDMLSGYCAGWSLRTLLHGGAERRARQGGGGAAAAPVERGRPDRQLPRHAAERVGRRAGVQLVRHLHGAVRPQGPAVATTRCASASRN